MPSFSPQKVRVGGGQQIIPSNKNVGNVENKRMITF